MLRSLALVSVRQKHHEPRRKVPLVLAREIGRASCRERGWNIGDWSSDVCSSDLLRHGRRACLRSMWKYCAAVEGWQICMLSSAASCRKRSRRALECSGPWPSYPCGKSITSPAGRFHLSSPARSEERRVGKEGGTSVTGVQTCALPISYATGGALACAACGNTARRLRAGKSACCLPRRAAGSARGVRWNAPVPGPRIRAAKASRAPPEGSTCPRPRDRKSVV